MENRKWYNISADNGESWTQQLLSKAEAEEHKDFGYIVNDKEFYKDLLMEQQEQM